MIDQMTRMFANDTRDHEMTILHEHGVYRHVRFARPDTSLYRFDLITWPHHLAVSGDLDGITFHASPEDMFTLFRSSNGSGPNYDYWAEKAGRHQVREWSEDRFRQQLFEHVSEDIRCGFAPRGIGRAVRRVITDDWTVALDNPHSAMGALNDFCHRGYEITGWEEWDCSDYTPNFVRACLAVDTGIRMYDHAHQPAAA
ncbi:hypothetical protein [Streptomonospora salina]|uniref:Uncharacterized protein n=1 Tax=Streptomonospora salina TaxID=104205 RepID=A0A841EIJ3_9ACTN|nr:hypothetical protein [Streptomonospora salina]MBB6000863.1 hypothetical protein [Streptomonospora salina]